MREHDQCNDDGTEIYDLVDFNACATQCLNVCSCVAFDAHDEFPLDPIDYGLVFVCKLYTSSTCSSGFSVTPYGYLIVR